MSERQTQTSNPARLNAYVRALMLGWTVVLVGSLVWNVHRERAEDRQVVRAHVGKLWAGHVIVWAVGLGGICRGARGLRKHIDRCSPIEQAPGEQLGELSAHCERSARLKAEQTLWATEEKLLVARRIQEKLLPDAPPELPGLDIGGVSYPADATSGDYFDYVQMGDGCVGIVVADVSGHGIGPALLAAETCAYLRALAKTSSDVGVILTHLNEFLADGMDDSHFVTLFLAKLDPRERSLVYASAGHPGYLLGVDGRMEMLAATGLPLGVMPNGVSATTSSIALETDQCVLLLTDGIPEAESSQGQQFGMYRTLEVLRANRSRPADEIAAALYQAARRFSDGQPQRDDMTAVVLKV